jgi:hypothetical protein
MAVARSADATLPRRQIALLRNREEPMDFNHLKDQLRQMVGGKRTRAARPPDDAQTEDRELTEDLEREIEAAFGHRGDDEEGRADWDRQR